VVPDGCGKELDGGRRRWRPSFQCLRQVSEAASDQIDDDDGLAPSLGDAQRLNRRWWQTRSSCLQPAPRQVQSHKSCAYRTRL
jgi:hypothetical protein